MSARTSVMVGVAALVLLAAGVGFGLTPKAVHIAACGSPFFPADRSGMRFAEAYECAFALDKRYTLLTVVFVAAGVLALVAVVGGLLGLRSRAGHAAS